MLWKMIIKTTCMDLVINYMWKWWKECIKLLNSYFRYRYYVWTWNMSIFTTMFSHLGFIMTILNNLERKMLEIKTGRENLTSFIWLSFSLINGPSCSIICDLLSFVRRWHVWILLSYQNFRFLLKTSALYFR